MRFQLYTFLPPFLPPPPPTLSCPIKGKHKCSYKGDKKNLFFLFLFFHPALEGTASWKKCNDQKKESATPSEEEEEKEEALKVAIGPAKDIRWSTFPSPTAIEGERGGSHHKQQKPVIAPPSSFLPPSSHSLNEQIWESILIRAVAGERRKEGRKGRHLLHRSHKKKKREAENKTKWKRSDLLYTEKEEMAKKKTQEEVQSICNVFSFIVIFFFHAYGRFYRNTYYLLLSLFFRNCYLKNSSLSSPPLATKICPYWF